MAIHLLNKKDSLEQYGGGHVKGTIIKRNKKKYE